MAFGKRTAPLPPDTISATDWYAVITLPVQVGIWMGRLDSGGGPEAEIQEQAAITAFLNVASQKFSNLPLIETIILAAQFERQGVINPMTEPALMAKCDDVLVCLKADLSPLELNAYKLLLIEMAEHVARAAPDRNLGPQNLMNGARQGWHGLYPALLNQTLRYNRGPLVSLAEKQGINRLIDRLDADHMVQKWDVGMGDAGPGVRVYGGPVNQRTTRATP